MWGLLLVIGVVLGAFLFALLTVGLFVENIIKFIKNTWTTVWTTD